MSSKAKARALAEDTEDEEVAAMLQARPLSEGDPNQWLRDNYGDLDWAYTAQVVRKWSHDALLAHIWAKSFSIPARDYNPSAPFVYVRMHDGEVVTLPHGYRLPLMFVAKYYWGITLSRLKSAESWKKERENVFHLSRLCENLFQRARAKAFSGGMEKGWRCLMFDRLLARFYKGWYRNDPPAGREFISNFGAKEYDRDVLKHDWKRWCTRGLNGVKMTEAEVVEGITIDQFREGLEKGTDGIWRLGGEPLPFITTQEDGGWSSVSELTDCDMDTDEGSDVNSEGDDSPGEDDDPETRRGKLPDCTTPSEKRPRSVPVDEDDLERASKRARIQPTLVEARPSPQYSHPRLAAITNDPGLVASSSGTPSEPRTNIIESSPRPEASRSSSLPTTERPTADLHSSTGNSNNTPGRSTSHVPSSSKPTEGPFSRPSPSKSEHSSKSPESVVVISRPKPKPSFSRSFSSLSTPDSSSRAGPSGSKTTSRPREVSSLSQRPSGSKPRQTRASRLAGVATVNVYVSEKPRAKAHHESNPKPRRKSPSREPSRSPSPSLSNLPPREQPFPPLSAATPIPLPQSAQSASATPVGPIVTTPLPLPTRTIFAPAAGPPPIVIPPALDTQPSLSRDAITTKALELLVNLVDMKQVLGNSTHSSSSTSSSAQCNSNDNNRPPDAGHLAFEGRFQNLEDRFSSVREEFKDIIGRLQDLEREAGEQRELKKVASERVFEDKAVDCRPATTTLGVETDRRDVQDVAIGNVNETAGGLDADGDVKMGASGRVLGEIAVQTEPEEERHHSQQPESRSEESSKGEQTPTQDVILTSVEMRTSDRNCGSETDTDSTVHIVKDDSVDPRTQEMSESLSFLVNNLVSAKMLTVVGDMLKGKARDTASVELDMSLRALSPVATPSSDSFALTNLLDEIKTLKEESRARSIREKEEMQAMRQLHSAEVDALRRRLSYLESQNTSIDPASSFGGTQHRSSSVHTIRDEAEYQLSSAEAPRHVHPPRHSSSAGRNFLSTSGSGQRDIARTSSLDSISSANPRPGTSAPAERSFTFARPGHERDDELPLPIKSQRKQHISFPRSTFS